MPETFATRTSGSLGTTKSNAGATGDESEELLAAQYNTLADAVIALEAEVGKKSAPAPGSVWADLAASDPTAGGDVSGPVSNISVDAIGGSALGDLSSPTNNYVLTWDSTPGEWVAAEAQGGAAAQSLQGVLLDAPVDNDITVESGDPIVLRDAASAFTPLQIVKTEGTAAGITINTSGFTAPGLTVKSGAGFDSLLSAGRLQFDKGGTLKSGDAASGNGGDLNIVGSDAAAGIGGGLVLETGNGGAGARGGAFSLTVQDGGALDLLIDSYSGANGGALSVTAGTSTDASGGALTLTAGAGATGGGGVTITGGDATAGAANGGNLVLDGGMKFGAGSDGQILIGTNNTSGGMTSGSISGALAWTHWGALTVLGAFAVQDGANSLTFNSLGLSHSGSLDIYPAASADEDNTTIYGGAGASAGDAGGEARLYGGAGLTTGYGGLAEVLGGLSPAGQAGDARLDGGATTSGTPGKVLIGNSNAMLIESGQATGSWTHTGDFAIVADGSAEGGVNKTTGIEIQDGASNVATARIITVDANPDGNVTENTGTLATNTANGMIYANVSTGGSGTSWSELVTGTGTVGSPVTLTWSAFGFTESETPAGTFAVPVTVTASGDTFATVGVQTAGAGNDYIVVGTPPAGLSVVVTVLSGATQATVALSGTASGAQDASDSIVDAFTVEFLGGAFTSAVAPIDGTQIRALDINYINQGGGGGLFDPLWHSTVTNNPDNANSAVGSQPYLPWAGYTEWPFKNHLKTGESFTISTGGTGGMIFDSDGYVSDLNGESYARTRLWNAELRSTSYVTAGQYAVLWDGTGTFAYAGDHFSTLDDATPGRNVITVVDGGAGSGNSNLEIRISAINTSDWPKNIRVVKTTDEATLVAQPFRDEFLDDYKYFKVIRFMMWNLCNESSMHETWATRPLVSSATYSGGVPYEVMISLCHRLNAHAYVCLPDTIDQTYADNFAVSMRDSFHSSLLLYVEVSNEVWNGGIGPQQGRLAQFFLDEGFPTEGSDFANGQRGLGLKSDMLFDSLETAYGAGDRAARVRRVIGTQGANLGVVGHTWDSDITNVIDKTDIVSVAPYFGHIISPGVQADLDYINDTAVATLLTDFTDGVGTTATSITEAHDYLDDHITQFATWHPTYSGGLMTYEGGPELRNYHAGATTATYDKLDAVADDEGIVQKYKDFLDAYKAGPADNFFIHFVGTFDRGANNRDERFGMKQYTGQADTEASANLYEALKEWATDAANARWFTP